MNLRVALLADSGQYDAAHAVAARTLRTDGVRPNLELEAQMDAIRGRLGEATQHLNVLRDQALARADVGLALEVSAAIGRLRLLAGVSSATSEVDRLLAEHPLDSVDVLSRPYLQLALFYADAGQTRRARGLLEAYEREYPARYRGPDRWMLLRTRAAMSRAGGQAAQALATLHEAARVPALRGDLFDDTSMRVDDRPELARVFAQAGLPDSAIAVYERYLSTRSLKRAALDAFELGSALETLGTLYERRGDQAQAAKRYNQLAMLWREADGSLQKRAKAAGRRASMLAAAPPVGVVGRGMPPASSRALLP